MSLTRPSEEAPLEEKLTHLTALQKKHHLSGSPLMKDAHETIPAPVSTASESIDGLIEATHRTIATLQRRTEIPITPWRTP